MKDLTLYEVMSRLFVYPHERYLDDVAAIAALLGRTAPEAAAPLENFLRLVPRGDLNALQELFVRSFDVQSMTTLDIGYVLFGDDYKRGELLANLNREYLLAEVDCGHELADHLPNLLRLLPRLRDQELASELVQDLLAPALNAMIAEFSHERILTKYKSYEKHYKTLLAIPGDRIEEQTIYVETLRALDILVRRDFSIPEWVAEVRADDFLASIQKENEIEERAESPHEFEKV